MFSFVLIVVGVLQVLFAKQLLRLSTLAFSIKNGEGWKLSMDEFGKVRIIIYQILGIIIILAGVLIYFFK